MKIFIDTADLDEIKEAASWGILDGVTTNPSLIKKAVEKMKARGKQISMEDYIKEICRSVDGPVSLEVKGRRYDEMVREAKILYEKFNGVNNNVVIKIPINTAFSPDDEQFEGIKAIKELESFGIPTNATLVMTPEQALLAAKAGASYVSPFLGRVDDFIRKNIGIKHGKMDYWDYEAIELIEQEERKKNIEKGYEGVAAINYGDNGIYSGVELVYDVIEIYEAYGYETKIIAASIRNARQVRQVAMLGVDIATIPFIVIKEMISHYKTMEGMKKFSEDVVEEYEEIFKS
ncbi:MAG: transaldolase [Thermoplasmata archaeon]|nr:transaldolase [Thermoplasmata archaeon]